MLYNKAMENETKQNQNVFDRRKFYNDGDSGKIFLFALLLPILISFIFTLIQNIIVGASGIEGDSITNNIWFNTAYGLVTAISYVLLYVLYNKINKIEYKAINLNFKMKWHTYLLVIAIGVVSLFGVQYFITCVDNFLKLIGFPLQISSPDMGESLTNPQSFGIFALSVIVTAVIPAISEELLFRGVILNGLRTRFNDYASIFISAALFALMHQNLQQLVYPFILGSIMAWIVLRTGSLVSSMIVHFINNFLVILFTYLQNVTNFSMALPNEWWFYLVAIVLLASTFGIIYLVDRFYFKHKSKETVERSSVKTSKWIYISVGVALALFVFITIFAFASAAAG